VVLLLLAIQGIPPKTQATEIEMVMPGPANVGQVRFTDRLHGVAMGIHVKNTPGSAIVWTDDGVVGTRRVPYMRYGTRRVPDTLERKT
jgi:hypothetical protein